MGKQDTVATSGLAPSNGKAVLLGSDNQAGAHPAILNAITLAAEEFVPAYGRRDALSERVADSVQQLI